MNLLLLDDADFVSADRAVLHDRRLKHLHEVHRAENGDTLRVGRLGGWMGEGRLLKLDASEATLEVRFDQPPPAKLPITLLLAVPRPKMLRRVLQTIAAMGVPKLVLLNSYRVEKSFWQTPFLDPAAIRENLVLGLEQARDTVLPEIIVEKRFKPFVEDRPGRRQPRPGRPSRSLAGLSARGGEAGDPGDRPGRRLDSLRGRQAARSRTASGAARRTHPARGNRGQRLACAVVLKKLR